MEGPPQQQNAPARVRVGIAEFAAKFQTKKEVYDFLTVDVKACCPPADTVTIWHLRDMASGVKGLIKGDDIRFLTVPYYDDLSIDKMITWTKANYARVLDRYFPVEKELKKFPR